MVNHAGIIHRGNALQTSDDEWLNVMSANLNGAFWMCRAAIVAMRGRGGGAIINVASDWGLVGGQGHVAEPAEQARCIRFLASDEASYVTGAVFSVDGGSTAR